MLGYLSDYSWNYLCTLMTLTTLFFALPILFKPLLWARLMMWEIPEKTDLAVYFGRCLGAFILIVEIIMLRAVTTGSGFSFAFDVLFLVFSLMLLVHIYGAIKKIQPITETLEIGLWAILLALNVLFYPAQNITL